MGDRQTPNHEIKGYIKDSDYSAQSVLVSVGSGAPSAVTLDEGDVIGRAPGGDAGAVGLESALLAILGDPDPGQVLSESGGGAAFVDVLAVTLDADTLRESAPPSIRAVLSAVQSAGYWTGGDLSQEAGTHNLLIAEISGRIKISDSETGANRFFTLAADSIRYSDLVDDALNYICVEYDAGSVGFYTTTDPANITGTTIFAIGIVYRNGTSLDILQGGQQIQNESARNNTRLASRGVERMSGSVVSETGTLSIAATSGAWYFGSSRFATPALSADTFEHYYYLHNAAWAEIAPTNKIDVTYYNNVSTPGAESLDALSTNRYGVHWVYQCFAGDLSVVFGHGNYTSVSAANAAQPPATLPNYLASFAALVGKVIVRKSASTFTSIESAFSSLFVPEGVTTHNNLAGLQGGTTDEYYHLTSAQITAYSARDMLTQVQVTADDTTTKLTAASYRKQLVTGSAALQWYNLGDTAAYTAGFEFEFENNSSEFIGVCSNHATLASAAVWERVPPGCTLKCVCVDPTATGGAGDGEKEGTWFTCLTIPRDPRKAIQIFEDFAGRAASNIIYGNGTTWVSQLDGTYGSIALGSSAAGSTCGYASHSTGANVAGYSHSTVVGLDPSAIGAAKEFEQRLSVNAISDGVQNYILRCGLHNGASGAAPTVGAYILADYSVSSSFYYQAKVINAGGNDTDLSAIAPAVYSGGTVWDRIRFEINSANSRMDAWVNNVQITAAGGLTTYLPNATCNLAIGLSKTLGNTARFLYSDYVKFGLYFSTKR